MLLHKRNLWEQNKKGRVTNFFGEGGFFICIDITAVIGLKTKIFNEQITCSGGIKKTDWLFQRVEERPNSYIGKIDYLCNCLL
jgi:hypothetical protein